MIRRNAAEWLCSLFNEFRPWSVSKWPQSRKVWIECFGLQPFAYSINNLRAIGEYWGTIIGFDEVSVSAKRVGSAKILIDVYHNSQEFHKGLDHP